MNHKWCELCRFYCAFLEGTEPLVWRFFDVNVMLENGKWQNDESQMVWTFPLLLRFPQGHRDTSLALFRRQRNVRKWKMPERWITNGVNFVPLFQLQRLSVRTKRNVFERLCFHIILITWNNVSCAQIHLTTIEFNKKGFLSKKDIEVVEKWITLTIHRVYHLGIHIMVK